MTGNFQGCTRFLRSFAPRGAISLATAVLGALALTALPRDAAAQATPSERADSTARKAAPLAAVTITATRTSTETFSVPQPVNVISMSSARDRLANTPVDLFRLLPGLDVTGVGSNQTRPQIRGQRGQRILLLEDGLRLNNSRRQQDFGELPALSGFTGIDRVEVVRGPSSVLYGTDAIGGVVNVISAELPSRSADGEVHGFAGYRYGGAGDQRMPSAGGEGRLGAFAFRASGAYRETSPYLAPAGEFGEITLPQESPVNETGVRDRSFELATGVDITSRQRLLAQVKRYHATDAAFGYVAPDKLGENLPLIDIGYPEQTYSRYSLGYRANSLGSPLADRFELTTYVQRNERDLSMHVLVPLGPPGATLDSRSLNFTDLYTVGMRAEASRLVLARHVLTYGVDYFRDRSRNTDSSTTVLSGFGPPLTMISRVPLVPNATFRSLGVFAQSELLLADRFTATLGARVQDIVADTRDTPEISRPLVRARHRTAVGTANMLYRVTGNLNLITSVGRGFRSPNLVERFFEGPAPEGSGYQRSNPGLEPETSLNVDIGARYRRGRFYAEAFAFRNDIRDGIHIEATGDSVNRSPAFRNVNVDRLRHGGLELQAGVRLLESVELSGNYTKLDSRNISDPNSPVGDSYGTKLTTDVVYRPAGGRLMLGYSGRYNGEQSNAIIGTSPIGQALPAFTVHSLRGRLLLLDRAGLRNSIGLTVENLTNELYAEASNTSFFRPEPRRSVTLSWMTEF
jgi:outer membrane receptor protein involved in Fe transport